MASDVGDGVRLTDHPGRIDQVADALGEVGVGMVGCPDDLVGRADGTVDVAQEVERELLRRGEGLVLLRLVERCTEDRAVEGGELCGAVTQRLALNRSTRGRRLGVPPQEHPTARLIGERHGFTVLIREGERRGSGAGNEHAGIVPRLRRPHHPVRGGQAAEPAARRSNLDRSNDTGSPPSPRIT